MKKFEIKGNKAISRILKTHTFEIVEKISSEYSVWSIGENMGSDEYIPFCEDLYPGDPKSFDINTETLKTIKLPKEEANLLRQAASEGIGNKEQAEKALRSKRTGIRAEIKKAYAEKTIEIFRRITA